MAHTFDTAALITQIVSWLGWLIVYAIRTTPTGGGNAVSFLKVEEEILNVCGGIQEESCSFFVVFFKSDNVMWP